MEMIDIYDRDGYKTGKTISRKEIRGNGEFCKTVIVITRCHDNYLLTKRDERKAFGGMWEFTGGGVQAGEESLCSAKRELYEETHLDYPEASFIHLKTLVYEDYNMILEAYLIDEDINEKNIVLQEGETVEYSIVPVTEIKKWRDRLTFLNIRVLTDLGIL